MFFLDYVYTETNEKHSRRSRKSTMSQHIAALTSAWRVVELAMTF
jgi:hypothetical protein